MTQEQGNDYLAEALALEGRLHQAGVRDAYRKLLQAAISFSRSELARETGSDAPSLRAVQRKLLRALAAAAEDARYGAGQLSRGAQRAPSLAATEEGWQRVEEIVRGAERAAEQARHLSEELKDERACALAQQAQVSAVRARRIVLERNRAYTFQSRAGYSFGEGWYLSAAAALRGVRVQVEEGSVQQAQALRFLKDAGLGHYLVPFRPRPASPKHLTSIIADAFGRDANAAQLRVREAFLGDSEPPSALLEWIAERFASVSRPAPLAKMTATTPSAPSDHEGACSVAAAEPLASEGRAAPLSRKVLLWVRSGAHHPHRNTRFDELAELSFLVREAGISPVYFGDALPRDVVLAEGIDLTLCWTEPLFQGEDMRRMQLHFFEQMRRHHGLVGQMGVTTAGMDGPALLGLPTAYLTDQSNVRLRTWVGVVPGYVEVVRGPESLQRVEALLHEWMRS